MNDLTNDGNRALPRLDDISKLRNIRPDIRLREPQTRVCLLWPEWPAIDFSRGGRTTIVSQRAGGSYRLTDDAKTYLEQNLNEMFGKRARITSWLVEQRYQGVNDPEITVEVIQSAKEDEEISIEQGAFNLLRYLVSYGNIGHAYRLRDDRTLVRKNDAILAQCGGNIFMFMDYARCLAASECDDWNDLGVYMDQLQAIGYVRMITVPDELGWSHYSVTFPGHQAAKGNAREFLIPTPSATAIQSRMNTINVDSKEVFVIHGRNETARAAIFEFLEAAGLIPIEWNTAVKATESATPYIGQILDAAFDKANAAIALMTPDDNAVLSEWLQREDDPPQERTITGQARPNVLFETGMAMARFQEKTIIVEVGNPKPFSDIAGRHTVRLADTIHCRETLLQRLETAGCPVDRSLPNWQYAGDFNAAISSASRGQDEDKFLGLEPTTNGGQDRALDHLNDKAKELLIKAAVGEGDDQGFIDDYRYLAGGIPIDRPDSPRAEAEFEEATEQLIEFELATRLVPQHMQDRRGLQLTERGYKAAEFSILHPRPV